jgi:hypothetical protein
VRDIHTTTATVKNGRNPIYFDVQYFINEDDEVELDAVAVCDGCGDDIAALLKQEVCDELCRQITAELKKRADSDFSLGLPL